MLRLCECGEVTKEIRLCVQCRMKEDKEAIKETVAGWTRAPYYVRCRNPHSPRYMGPKR